MINTVKRYPSFELRLQTEESDYILRYDTKKQLNQADLEQAIISFSVKNSMEDDSPVFSLVLLGKEHWDAVLGSNDLIQIKVIPDTDVGEPSNPYIMVGLLSEIHKEGEYEGGLLIYRITGRAMTKALIDFEVGVIQEVSTVITDFGWLPDGEDTGLNFTDNTAAGIGQELMDRFVYKYIKYKFKNGKSLKDYFVHEFYSWEEYESLSDVTPFINYEGSMRQFLEDVTAKPFNELFFEFTKDGKCKAIMRPTPFDPDRWGNLKQITLHSDSVVEESFGKSDTEMFSVFVVHAPNLPEFSSVDLGVFPKYHPDLLHKYGYKRLDAENRYLLSSGLSEALGEAERVEGASGDSGNYPDYDSLMEYINSKKLADAETLRTNKNKVQNALLEAFPTFSGSQIQTVVDLLATGELNRSTYTDITIKTGDADIDARVNKEKTVANANLELFTNKLFNWYSDNANFYGGDLRVIGSPKYRIGTKVLYKDKERNLDWEFYLESVQHEFSFSGGYTTILGVTRGLPYGGKRRFSNLWGKAEEFKGGYMGEKSLEDLAKRAEEEMQKNQGGFGNEGSSTGGTWGGGTAGGVAGAAMNLGLQMATRSSVYVFGGGRTGKNPFDSSPIKTDCSSFVWWCYYLNGVTLNGGKTGMTTDTIKVDRQLQTINPIRGSKKEAMSKLQAGDIVYFDTYKVDGHLGIYTGNGKFVGSQGSTGIAVADMSSGYWWDKFNGRVLRYNG